MKLGLLFTVAALTFSSVAYASDTRERGHIQAHETHALPVSVPSGNTDIEVWDDDSQPITCSFVHKNDKPVSTGKTSRCVFHVRGLTLPVDAHVRVVNDNNQTVVWTMTVHNQ